MKSSGLDSQQVELMGRNLLLSCFVADGIEVALPLRDRGIDLIAFSDIAEDNEFRAIPVQLKASSSQSFSVHRKYEKFPNLLMAYVWNAETPMDAIVYVLPYSEVLKIAGQLGWTKTNSWIVGKLYSTQSPSKKLLDAMEKFKYEPGSLAKIVSNKNFS